MKKETTIRKMERPTMETKRRKKEVLQKYRAGWSRKKIADWLEEQYKIGATQAYKIIHDAILDLCESTKDVDYEEVRKTQLERAEELLEIARERNDIKSAIKAQDMINRLNGLYVEKQEIKAEIETWTFEYGE